MERFSYAKYFDEHKVFDISNKEDITLMQNAVNDAYKIERYFFNKIPDMNNFRWIIAFSFKLDKNLKYEDRINYIRGMVYCMRYISLNDIEKFREDVSPTENSIIIVDIPTIFTEKEYSELKELNGGFFDDDELTSIQYLKRKYNKTIPAFILEEEEIELDEEDEDEEEDEINFNKVNTMEVENDYNQNIEDQKNKVKEYLDNLGSNISGDMTVKELFDDVNYIDITAGEKIQNFKNNFNEFVKLSLAKKDISLFKRNSYGINDVSKEAAFVVKGMNDWFNYTIHILESLFLIGPEDVKKYMLNFSEFI